MGIIKLALLGGAGYLAYKKLNENKANQQRCQGQCQHGQQSQQGPYVQGRDMSEYFNAKPHSEGYGNEKGGYGNEKGQQREQRYYDFEPDYSHKQPQVSQRQIAMTPPEEVVRGEKQEYQRNF